MKNLDKKTITGAPATYHSLISRYLKDFNFDYVIEGGSRDIADAIKLHWTTNKKVYAFECNPSCVDICKKNLEINKITSEQVLLIPNALYHENKKIDFYCTIDTPKPPCGSRDPNLIEVDGKMTNIGTSSVLPFTESWSTIHTSKKVTVDAVKLDSFIESNGLVNKDYILCLDLQGAEYYAIMGNVEHIKNCKMIILEGGTHQYKAPDECKMKSLDELLSSHGFRHINKGETGDFVYSR